MFSCLLHKKMISTRQCQMQKKTSQWRILPVCSQLNVVPGVSHHTASANPFLMDGSWPRRYDTTFDMVMGGEVDLDCRAQGALLASSTWSNSHLIFTLLPVHEDMFSCLFHTKIISKFFVSSRHTQMYVFELFVFVMIFLNTFQYILVFNKY